MGVGPMCMNCVGVDCAAPDSEMTAIAAVLAAGPHRKSAEVIALASCPRGNIKNANKHIEVALGIEKLILVNDEVSLGNT